MLGLKACHYSDIEFFEFIGTDLEGRGSFRARNLLAQVEHFFLKALRGLTARLDFLGDIRGSLAVEQAAFAPIGPVVGHSPVVCQRP